ncbi:hypothetical protein CCHL11_02416 [Colletotrichum chlorophyti]|uniref:Uncharacterized protein n=1 Tax=Colletotrichum chlorophyti TaxID=708187 RepID=A0A1Q8S5X5_9PEZI|nr:hypothetical protein CCHL11_02416 [Colletotrichum chlorophyti]
MFGIIVVTYLAWSWTWITFVLLTSPTLLFDLGRAAQDFPKLHTQFAWETKEFRWKVVELYVFSANTPSPSGHILSVVGQNEFIGSATAWSATHSPRFVAVEDNEDDVFSPSLYFQPRGRMGTCCWLSRFANGSRIQPKSFSDWYVWETPQINVPPFEGCTHNSNHSSETKFAQRVLDSNKVSLM